MSAITFHGNKGHLFTWFGKTRHIKTKENHSEGDIGAYPIRHYTAKKKRKYRNTVLKVDGMPIPHLLPTKFSNSRCKDRKGQIYVAETAFTWVLKQLHYRLTRLTDITGVYKGLKGLRGIIHHHVIY